MAVLIIQVDDYVRCKIQNTTIAIVDRFATLKWSDDGCSTTVFSNTNILTFLPDAEKPAAATGGFEEKGTSSETRPHLRLRAGYFAVAHGRRYADPGPYVGGRAGRTSAHLRLRIVINLI
jgi:hypothetical protein